MDRSWWHLWWLIFPLMWFAFGGLRMVLGHRRQKETLQLLQTYAASGKDPPAEVLKVLQSDERPAGRCWGGPQRMWRRVVILGSLSLGFGVAAYLDPGTRSGNSHIFVAVILGALALGFVIMALAQRNSDDQ